MQKQAPRIVSNGSVNSTPAVTNAQVHQIYSMVPSNNFNIRKLQVIYVLTLLVSSPLLPVRSYNEVLVDQDYPQLRKEEIAVKIEVDVSLHRTIMGGEHLLRLPVHFCSFFALLIVFSYAPVVTCVSVQKYNGRQLDALQVLWRVWNQSTPDLSKNLAGWNSTQRIPCTQRSLIPKPSWRGVECLLYVDCVGPDDYGNSTCDAYITSLTLNNASLVGSLPSNISGIDTLTTLELTGNPNLTGTLPDSLKLFNNLHNVYLQDNDFIGSIPDLTDVQNVDLSGNHFIIINGSFPLPTMRRKGFAQIVRLGSNDFEGVIPEAAFANMTNLIQLDLSNNKFAGALPTLSNCRSLQTLNLSFNNFSGTLPNLTTMPSLHSVDLRKNAFTGSALGFWNSSVLQNLYLDNNSLNGPLDISKLSSLGLLSTRSLNSSGKVSVLSFEYNNISDVIFNVTQIEDITTIIRLKGNPYCKNSNADDLRRCFCTQVCKIHGKEAEDKRKIVIIASMTSASFMLILLLLLAALLHRNRRYKRYLQLQVQQKFEEFEVKPTIFPYNQLRTATRDFHPDMKLGQGSFGAVYKGVLPNGNEIAVKQLFAKTSQGIDEFLNEVVLLTGMKHRHLVKLKGCCIREQQRLLVYEYVDNYDIEKVLLTLNQGTNTTLLSWPTRLKILLGVARGLHYLHAHAQPRIIHRDIKPSNILLTKNNEAKIADFGLAFLFPDEESYIMTKHVAGTKGYLAPEYASLGQLSDKVDIFSFGVLCLEVVSGRKNIDERRAPTEMYLFKVAWDLQRRGNLMDIVDPRMSLQDEEREEVHCVINIALLCIQNEAEHRPTTEQVVAMLQGGSELEVEISKPVIEEEYLESVRLFALGRSGLGTVTEESESTSSSRREGGRHQDRSSFSVLELSEIRGR